MQYSRVDTLTVCYQFVGNQLVSPYPVLTEQIREDQLLGRNCCLAYDVQVEAVWQSVVAHSTNTWLLLRENREGFGPLYHLLASLMSVPHARLTVPLA